MLLLGAGPGCERGIARGPVEPATAASPETLPTAAPASDAGAESHAATEPATITIVALPDGRVRLASGEEVSDEEFLARFASSEQLARMRADGREVVIFVQQADGVSLERVYEFVAKVKIPGVLAATRLH